MPPARATLFVTLFVALSRVLGFVRDVLLTRYLGTGVAADAFLAAFRLPNTLRRIAAEGGFNPAFIPLYLKLKAQDEDGAKHFAQRAILACGLVLVLATIIGEVAAGPIMKLLAPGLSGEAARLAVLCFRLIFPLMLGSGLAALLSAVLNAERRVVATSFAPLVCNLMLVIAITTAALAHVEPVRGAGWIAFVSGCSGFAHLAIAGFALHRSGALRSSVIAETGTGLRRFVRTALPTLLAVGAAQLFPIAAAQVASHIPSAVSWFYYADRLFQLPAGFIAAAAGIVLLPRIAAHHARNDWRAGFLTQNRALESALLFSLPAAAGLYHLALPIASVLFEHGAFRAEDSAATAAMLKVLSAALPCVVMAKVFSNATFAYGRIRIPITAGLVGLIVTYLSARLLLPLMGVSAVALGTVIGLVTHFLILATGLWLNHLWRPDARLLSRLLRIVLATALMVLCLWGLEQVVTPHSLLRLALHCITGLITYALAAWTCGAISRQDFRRLKRR